MCEQKMPGFFARQAIYAKGRRMLRDEAAQQQQPCQCHQPAPRPSAFDRATKKAERALAAVGTVFAMFLIGSGVAGVAFDALAWVLAVAAGLGVLAFAGVLWRVRAVNRREALAWTPPPPDPGQLTPQVQAFLAQGMQWPAGSRPAIGARVQARGNRPATRGHR